MDVGEIIFAVIVLKLISYVNHEFENFSCRFKTIHIVIKCVL